MDTFFTDFKKYEWPTLGYILLPKYVPSPEDAKEYGMDESVSSYENLKRATRAGYKKRQQEKLIPERNKDETYLHRIKSELEVFDDLGFSDYILMVNSITDYARRNDILSGAGRGSCVGSIVLFLLGVTQVDPVKAKLIFERFISAERAQKKEINGQIYIDSSSLPDVDLDFPMTRKDEVRRFIESRFPNRVASISNFSRLTAKVLMKDVVKIVEEVKEEQAKLVSDIIEKKFGKVQDINEAMRENKAFIKWMVGHEKSVEIACKLSDLIRNKSVHASGLIVTENETDSSIPLEMTKAADDKDRHICSVYDMIDAQKLGIKIDNLGLKTLDAISDCLKMVNKKFYEINPEDPSIYQYLQHRNEFHGLFQIESGIGEQTIKKVRPRNIEELTDCISIARPGSYKFIDEYVMVKDGLKNPKIHEKLLDILDPTKGILIFQEQLMAIAVRMGNFTLIEADKIRKIVGKKLRDQMPEWEKKFIDGSLENGYEEAFAKGIWQSFIDSADYSFNKSHGRAYATLTAITTYLKAHYPLEFFLAALKIAMVESESQQVIGKIYSEMIKSGIKLLPPHLIKSDYDFKIEGKGIRFGLMAIKGLKEKIIQKVSKFRETEKAETETNINLFHFFKVAKQAGLTVGALSALIQAGACDVPTGKTRSRIVAEAQLWNILKDHERILFEGLGERFDYDTMRIMVYLRDEANAKREAGHKFKRGELKPSRIDTIRRHFTPFNEILKMNSKTENFTNWFYQRKLLGFCYDQTLKNIFLPAVPGLIDIAEVQELEHKDNCIFMAVVNKAHSEKYSQKLKDDGTKTKYVKLEVSDESASIEVLFFNDNIERIKSQNNADIKDGDIVKIIGKKFNDAIFADKIRIHSHEVFTKLSDLKTSEDKETEKRAI